MAFARHQNMHTRGEMDNEIHQPFFRYFEGKQIAPHKEAVIVDTKWVQLSFLLDRSGSMSSFNTEKIIESIKSFITDQMAGKEDHKFTITVFSFDDKVRIVFDNEIKTVDDVKITVYDISPRSGTALIEANAFGIEYIGRKCANWGTTNGDSRPATVVFATMTDGEENYSSGEWNGKPGQDKLSAIVKEHTEKWEWKFFFLAANIDSQATGSVMGYNVDQCIDFHTSNEGYDNAFQSCSRAVHENRGFSQEERNSSLNPF